MRVLTWIFVTVPSQWRAWRWRRVQRFVSQEWLRERKRQRALENHYH